MTPDEKELVMPIGASAFAKIIDPVTPSKIALDTGLSTSQVRAWVTHVQSFEDRSGYRVFFRVETPEEIRAKLPGLTSANVLIVLAA
jgi:hypothetical protein